MFLRVNKGFHPDKHIFILFFKILSYRVFNGVLQFIITYFNITYIAIFSMFGNLMNLREVTLKFVQWISSSSAELLNLYIPCLTRHL